MRPPLRSKAASLLGDKDTSGTGSPFRPRYGCVVFNLKHGSLAKAADRLFILFTPAPQLRIDELMIWGCAAILHLQALGIHLACSGTSRLYKQTNRGQGYLIPMALPMRNK